MKYVHYQSIGNTVGLEESIEDYWEIDEEGYVVRSIHIQPDGSRLKYDETHAADHLGVLPEGKITETDLADRSFGKVTFISLAEFDDKWSIRARNEEE